MHEGILDFHRDIGRLIMDTTDEEHQALSAVAIRVEEPSDKDW